MPIPSDYRHRTKALRRTMGLKQPDFAALVGVSPITISRWENGQNDPTELGWARIEELEKRGLAPGRTSSPLPTGPQHLDFGADPEPVAAVAEAVRLSSGHLASPTFATEISLIDPLPHQRVAVYDQILKSWPIRFLLADDAGAGKTIMTGLHDSRAALAEAHPTRAGGSPSPDWSEIGNVSCALCFGSKHASSVAARP